MTELLANNVEALKTAKTLSGREDFLWIISPHLWTITQTNSGTTPVIDTGHCKGIKLTPANAAPTTDDGTYIGTTNAFVTFTNNKPVIVEGQINFSEANTNKMNFAFGLTSNIVTGLQAASAGPPTSFTGLLIYKIGGTTNWKCMSSVGTTQTISDLTAAISLDKTLKTAGGATDQLLRIEFLPFSSTQADVLFYIDGVVVAKHLYTYTSAVAVSPAALIRMGSSTAEVANVRYIGWETLR